MSMIGAALGVSFGCGFVFVFDSVDSSWRRIRFVWDRLVHNDAALAARISVATIASVATIIICALLRLSLVLSLVLSIGITVVALVVQSNQWQSVERKRKFQVALVTPAWLDVLTLCLVAGLPLTLAIEQSRRHASPELAQPWQAIENAGSVPIASALARVQSDASDPATQRVASSLLIALERGTPVADVLEDLSAEIRSENRRALLEIAAKKDVTMMLPVVFGILPAVTVIALYPALQTLTSLR